MSAMKDAFIQAHEELISEYLETHPGVSWDTAYERCADGAYDKMRDNLADHADNLRQQKKDNPDG